MNQLVVSFSNLGYFCDVFNCIELRPSSALSEADILAVAVEEEYKIFSANKVITTYRYMGEMGLSLRNLLMISLCRRGMAFLMAEVKKDTDAWRLHQGCCYSVLP